jgi:hypothetical protein
MSGHQGDEAGHKLRNKSPHTSVDAFVHSQFQLTGDAHAVTEINTN